MVSNYAQWIFQKVLEDHDFVDKYIQINQTLLTESYLVAVKTFRKLNIPYVPAAGSLFVWIDLSEFLSEQSQEAENQFWLELYQETGILLTPGEGFGHSKEDNSGWFSRVCLKKIWRWRWEGWKIILSGYANRKN